MSSVKTGDSYSGFKILSMKELNEYRSTAIRCVHRATGCELLHLANEDRENLFAFCFRTPPRDDTGAPHILEHSVLCGSRRFPLKDPFVVLLKSSVNTYLNAITFPDKTIYPAGSMLEKDFFNLMLVYGDAVFFPLLKNEVFMQEGHHLEFQDLTDPESDLKRVGVVFNEMKGAFSSQEILVAIWSMRSLFPDTPYAYESGGDPQKIPGLSYEQLVQFHSTFYHPSNCKIFLYGNIPTVKQLEFIQENFLKEFSKREIDSKIPLQPRWQEPMFFEKTFPVQEGKTSVERRSSVTMNWLTVPVTDPLKLISFEVLTEILTGNAGSPLHKALLESGLGEDLSPTTGIDSDLKEVIFSVGLRGTDRDKVKEIEGLIIAVLTDLRDGGIDESLIDAALQRIEFRNREIRRGGRPYSIKIMHRALRGWMHGTEPETTLEFTRWMCRFKEKISKDKHYLADLLDEYFINNPHRSTLLAEPDPHQAGREEEESKARLEQIKYTLTEKAKRAIIDDSEKLRRFQRESETSEEINKIPAIDIQDLPLEVEKIPTQTIFQDLGMPVYFHDLFTNGIVYLDIVFDTSGIDEELSVLLPLFCRAVCGCGLSGVPYFEAARRLSLTTGGFYAALSACSPVDLKNGIREHLIFRVKMLENRLSEAILLIWDLITRADFDDLKRIENIILEQRNDLKSSIIPAGHHFTALRAGSRLSKALQIEEHWKGISQLFSLAELTTGLKEKLKELVSSLKRLREILISKDRLILNLTFDSYGYPEGRVKDELYPLIQSLPSGNRFYPAQPESGKVNLKIKFESIISSSKVGCVSKAIPCARYGTKESAHESILSHFLRTGFLWEHIRMRGGAYGAFAMPNGLEGIFTFSSFRDPNIVDTFQAYRGALRYARDGDISEEELEKAVIGTIGQEDRPLDPGEKGFVALKRILYGITDDLRQRRKGYMMSIRRGDLAGAADNLLKSFDKGCSVVLSNRRALEKEGREMKELLDTITEVPE